MPKRLISSIAVSAFVLAASGSAFAADMAVKVPPPAPAPVPTWTGFYAGIQVGGGWSDEAVNYSPNDPVFAEFLGGTSGLPGQQPMPNYQVSQKGPVGGVEAGYNWQASNWLLGVEADFSFAGLSGRASATSIFIATQGLFVTNATTAQQSTDWYGTIRGRVGWLATPNLLLFGTGGFAYGRVADSANFAVGGNTVSTVRFPFGINCPNVGQICAAGSSSAIRTGWTAGGGVEWLLDQHWSAKVEYQLVDLGTQTVQITAFAAAPSPPGLIPASFNAAFHDRFNVVRLGLNYRF